MRLFVLITHALIVSVTARPHAYPPQTTCINETKVVIETVPVTIMRNFNKPACTSPVSASAVPMETAIAKSQSPFEHNPSPSSLALETHPTVSASQVLDSAPHLDMHPAVHSIHHASGPNQAYLAAGPSYRAAVLFHHNAIRANHHAAPLTWDSKCEANARLAAKRCDFEHFIPRNTDQGQNLFTVSGSAFNVTAAITESWYNNELPLMKPWFGKPSLPHSVFEEVGHLTQLVWKGTTKVGCVSLDCGTAMTVHGQASDMNKYTVCNYAPAGNLGGKYAKNVVRPIPSAKRVGWAD